MEGKIKTTEGWITIRLDEIGTIFSGSTPSTSNRSLWDGDIVWVTPNDLSKLKTPYLCDSGKMITEKGLKSCSAQLLPAGSLVMSSRAPIGYVALPTVQFCTNQGCKTIKLKGKFHPEFTYYNVLFNIDKVKNLGEGTTFAEISKASLSTVELDFPATLSEQTKIAEILSTTDRAIEQTEALIAKQQRIKTGLMQDLLTRGIDEHGNLRSEKTHQFKNSPLGRIPVEWKVKEIGDIFEIQLGKMLSQKATEGHSPFYYLGNKNVQWDHVETSDLQMMDFNERERHKYDLKLGDILVCEGGEVGRTAIWRGEVGNCYYQKAIHRLRPVNQQYLPGLFPKFMKWCIRMGLLSDFTSQTSIAHLTQEKLATVPIMVPSLPEQKKLIAVFDQLDNDFGNQFAKLIKLRSLKTALMQDLLTGRKRIATMRNEIEVASPFYRFSLGKADGKKNTIR